MASSNTGVRQSQIMEELPKSFHCVVKAADGIAKPYFLSKRMCELKNVEGEAEPVLFAQTWYAKRIGLAQ